MQLVFRREKNLNALTSRRHEAEGSSDPLPIGWKDNEAVAGSSDAIDAKHDEVENLRPKTNMRRSPSYTQAVTSDPSSEGEAQLPEYSDLRYKDGKVYQKVDNDEV